MAEFEAAKKTVWDNVREGVDAACAGVATLLSRPAAVAKTSTATRESLGVGVRLCQLYYILVLASALAYAVITAPADFAYDFSLVHGMATSALAAVAIWLFEKRYTSARPFGIGAAIAIAVLSAIDMFALGAFPVVADRKSVV